MKIRNVRIWLDVTKNARGFYAKEVGHNAVRQLRYYYANRSFVRIGNLYHEQDQEYGYGSIDYLYGVTKVFFWTRAYDKLKDVATSKTIEWVLSQMLANNV